MKLEEFLEYKSLYYDKIDYTIIKKSWDSLSTKIKLPYVIHIVGTNGKGSTGRFLAHYLYKTNYKVLHYSSPHILEFNERIWIDGFNVLDESLELAHEFLQKSLEKEYLDKLTYFEYTTLLALYLSSDFDYLILEAGLGGEFDATNVVKNDLSLITTIDLDHQAFLGNTIKEIASTKLRSCDTKMILNKQHHSEVLDIAKEYNYSLVKEYDTTSLHLKFPKYLHQNLKLALTALEYLNIDIDLNKFLDLQLFGRCEKIANNVTIDVGHNPLAAQVIAQEFKDKKVDLIYNSYKDKEYVKVLEILKPIINRVLIMDIDDKRVVEKELLQSCLESLDIEYFDFNNNLDKNKEYLVFGSFSVVEKFLRGFDEK